MLKIKDSVDLKKLKKYGFIHKKETDIQYEHYICKVTNRYDISCNAVCCVWCDDRHIGLLDKHIGVNVLFDLIQAGLVEKV